MNNLKLPRPLLFTGNVAQNYLKFKQKYELYMLASGGTKQSPEVQTAILLTIVGEAGLEIFNTSNLIAEDKKDPQKVLQSLETCCIPRVNVCGKAYFLLQRTERSYVMELKKLSRSCEFGEMKDSLIKYRIISGLLDNEVKTKLLNIDELSLEKFLQICKNAELTRTQLKTVMHGAKMASIHAVNNGRHKRERKANNNVRNGGKECSLDEEDFRFSTRPRGHRRMTTTYSAQDAVRDINEMYVWPTVKPATVNIIPSTTKLQNYSGLPIQVIGKCFCKCTFRGGITGVVELQVVSEENNTPSVLGLPTIELYGLVKSQTISRP
ncbi:hypothetical protein PR048_001614, partial [Dryococelus australis]